MFCNKLITDVLMLETYNVWSALYRKPVLEASSGNQSWKPVPETSPGNKYPIMYPGYSGVYFIRIGA
jgi:hypothetical protein